MGHKMSSIGSEVNDMKLQNNCLNEVNVKSVKLKNDIIAMLLLFVCGWFGLLGGQAQPAAAADLIRLHIFANSDSAYDQRVKLIVRDAVLDYVEDLLQGTVSEAATEAVIEKNLVQIDAVADGVAANYGYTANTAYGVFAFSERTWGNTVMPAGNYKALKIELGSGRGHNWFCVLYPDLSLEENLGKLQTTGRQADAEPDVVAPNSVSAPNQAANSSGQTLQIHVGSFFAEWLQNLAGK